jgi:transposase-like protein
MSLWQGLIPESSATMSCGSPAIATDFGVHPMTLTKWMRQADVDDGAKPARSTGESGELRELRRRNRLLE